MLKVASYNNRYIEQDIDLKNMQNASPQKVCTILMARARVDCTGVISRSGISNQNHLATSFTTDEFDAPTRHSPDGNQVRSFVLNT